MGSEKRLPKYEVPAVEIGEMEVDLEYRLAFLELSEEDAQRLRQLETTFADSRQEFAEVFYRHLLHFDETAKFFQNAELVARLKELQQRHFDSLLHAQWGDDFVSQRHKVGEAHANLGVEPQFFLGAYNQYLQHWLSQLGSQCDDDLRPHIDAIQSLVRAVILDIGLTLDAFFHRSTQNMRQALNLYWNANNELRQFAQLASHDIKTPLATVANLCDEALDEFGEQMPPEANQLIEQARQRAFRMSSTIDELLAAAVFGGEEAEVQNVNSLKVLHEVVEQLRPLIDKKGITLTLPERLPSLPGDPARLREIFHNLISNAAKFIDKSPGTIDVRLLETEIEWVFMVTDNGSGIPPEELELIFSPFRRGAAHQSLPGTGLGLYFTRNLVHQCGGRIAVESELGEGSQFSVTLPRAE